MALYTYRYAAEAIPQYSLVKLSSSIDGWVEVWKLADDPGLVMGVALTRALAVGVRIQVQEIVGVEVTMISDGTTTIDLGDTVVPSDGPLDGRIRQGNTNTIGFATSAAAAVAGAEVRVHFYRSVGGSVGGAGSYYQTIQVNTAPQTQRDALDFSSLFTASDSSSPSRTTLTLANTAVTPGSYTLLAATIDAQGRIVAAANGSIPNTAVTPGSYTSANITVGSDGRITAASNGSAGPGTLAALYAAGVSAASSTFSLDATRLGLTLKDNATPISGALFSIQNAGGPAVTFFEIGATQTQVLRSGMADGASAIGALVDTQTTWSNATARLFSVKNANAERFAVMASGNYNTSTDGFWYDYANQRLHLGVPSTNVGRLSIKGTNGSTSQAIIENSTGGAQCLFGAADSPVGAFIGAANNVNFYLRQNNANVITMTTAEFSPTNHNAVDLGSTSFRYKDVWLATVNGSAVPLRRANASDTLLTNTSPTDVLDYTTIAAGNFLVAVYLRVVTGTTNVTVNCTYTDQTGAQTQVLVPAATPTVVGSYPIVPVYINAANATSIKVTATAGTANQLYVSATITGY